MSLCDQEKLKFEAAKAEYKAQMMSAFEVQYKVSRAYLSDFVVCVCACLGV